MSFLSGWRANSAQSKSPYAAPASQNKASGGAATQNKSGFGSANKSTPAKTSAAALAYWLELYVPGPLTVAFKGLDSLPEAIWPLALRLINVFLNDSRKRGAIQCFVLEEEQEAET